MAQRDAPATELGGDPAAVPVAQHPHEEDRPLEVWREVARVAGARAVKEPGEAGALEPLPPAEQRCPAAAPKPARVHDRRSLGPQADRPGPSTHDRSRAPTRVRCHRPAALRRDE